MHNPRGRVLSFTTNGDDLRAVVDVPDMPACARCAAGKGCGAGLFVAGTGSRRVEAVVSPELRLEVGDEVELQVSPDSLLQASFLVYGVPLSGGVAGAAAAYALSLGDAGSALLALLGVAGGMLVSRRYLGVSGCVHRFTPRIERLS